MSGNQPRLFSVPAHYRRGRNARALGTTVQAMRDAGQLERVDAALIELARTSAGLLDAALDDADESRFVLGRRVAAHGRTLDGLRALAPGGTDALDALLADLSTVTGDGPHP
jgi:hypothetical protein